MCNAGGDGKSGIFVYDAAEYAYDGG